MKRFAFSLTQADKISLKSIARRYNSSMSAILRYAIRKHPAEIDTERLSEKPLNKVSPDISVLLDKTKQLQAAAGSMAHEFRQPLTSTQLTADTLIRFFKRLSAQQDVLAKQYPDVDWDLLVSQEDVEKKQALLKKLSTVIASSNTLLSLQLHNIQAGKICSQNFGYHSLQECLTQALQNYPFTNPEQQQEIQVNWSGDFSFWGDTTLLNHLIWNLLHNALAIIEEVQKGEIFITSTETHQHFLLHIKDTAKGMSATEAHKIFEPFYTQRHNGTGLGLYFCNQVMKAFQGFIFCDAKPKKYAEFTLGFPKEIKP